MLFRYLDSLLSLDMTVTLVLVARYVLYGSLGTPFVLLQIAFRHDLLLDILEYDEEDRNDD